MLDRESLSDHKYIYFEIEKDRTKTTKEQQNRRRQGWQINTLNKEILIKEIKRWKAKEEEQSIQGLIEELKVACDMSMKKTSQNRGRNPVYWWTEEIAQVRRECVKTRRIALRINSQGTNEREKENAHERYKEKRRELSRKIQESKEKSWKELCEEVEENPWGTGYQIVMGKLKRQPTRMNDALRRKVIKTLFPPRSEFLRPDEDPQDMPSVTEKEIREITKKLKNGKSPGPGGVPAEIIKIFAEEASKNLAEIVSKTQQEGRFPESLKTARVVLIRKGKKSAMDPSDYRPIRLLNTLGKLIEGVIGKRLRQELEEKEPLSRDQYGFMPGKSTIDALQQIKGIVFEEREKTQRIRQHCALILIDIKNTFNTASWRHIVNELDRRKMSGYLQNIISDYLRNRNIVDEEGEEYEMTGGVPQGSIIGPLLWNILYDNILRLEMPAGVRSIAYADDLAILVKASTTAEVKETAEIALASTALWMERHGLEVAVGKTEAILLSGKKKAEDFTIDFKGQEIKLKRRVKYLGVIWDDHLIFHHHVTEACKKATTAVNQTARLMPNIGGPGEGKRRLLCSVAHSIMLYRAPIWEAALLTKKYRKMVKQVQRKCGLRIARGYRTIGAETIRVIAGVVPIELLVEEKLHGLKREETTRKWQERWRRHEGSRWTKELNPEIRPWIERKHGTLSFHLTQVISGTDASSNFCTVYRKQKHLTASTAKNKTMLSTRFSNAESGKQKEAR